MKQTAVEWLRDKLLNPDVRLERDMYDFIYKLIEQAKAMEKEQIIDFAEDYEINESEKYPQKTFEQYYDETFK